MGVLRVTAILAMIACGCAQFSLQAKETKAPPRRVIYTYSRPGIVIVIVQENDTGAKGNVTFAGASKSAPMLQDNFYISRAEFEQIWSTLDAPGVEKRPYAGSEYEAEDYYIFDGGKQRWSVKKAQSTPAVSKLASRLRGHVDALIKRGMKPMPVERSTAFPNPH
jgi:hypothetical protein